MTKKELGDFGEKMAIKFLRKYDYKMVEQNFRTRYGEIDIIAKIKDEYVFIEVKTRTTSEYGQPQDAVDFYKQNKMVKTAFLYLDKHDLDKEFRVDIIAINIDFKKRNARVKHFIDVMGVW